MTIEIDADTVLSQISTLDLVYELNMRSRERDMADLDLDGIIELLEKARCPQEIVSPLRNWVYSKLLTQEDLDYWILWVSGY